MPPEGYTGHKHADTYPTRERVAAWIAAEGHKNIGLRLPRTAEYEIIGIDLDAYKDGALARFDELCQEEAVYGMGRLPDTFITTARSDGRSGIRLFKVELGIQWRDIGKGIEVIRHAHRFAVVWPSVHPDTGSQYAWYFGEWPVPEAKLDRIPGINEIPWLTRDWVQVLLRAAERPARSTLAGETGPVRVDPRDGRRVDWEEVLAGGLSGYGTERDALIGLAASARWYGVPNSGIVRMCREAAERYNTNTTGRHDPVKPWKLDEVDRLVADVLEGKEGAPIPDPEMTAWAARLAASSGNESVPTPKPVIDALIREKAQREARRLLDEEEAAELRAMRRKWTAEEFAREPKPDAVIERVLAEVVGLAGPPGEGKSMLARDWVCHVCAGEPWRGYRVQQRAGLWVASEGMHDFSPRFTGHPLWDRAKERLYVVPDPVNLADAEDVRWLLEEHREERPGIVVFDVVNEMGLEDDNSARDVKKIIAVMKKIAAQWHAAVVAVGHPGLNGQRRFRGSSAWRQLLTVEWHMADGALTCEKSKIADRRSVGANYRAEYPELRWLTAGEVVQDDAQRMATIAAHIEQYPGLPQRERARQLAPQFGLSESHTKRLISRVQAEI